MKEYSGRIYF